MGTRRLLLALIVVLGTVGENVRGQTPAEHASSLSGRIVSPICWSDDFAAGEASGDVAGSFSLAFDCNDGGIGGGTWRVVVTGVGPDGNVEEVGTLGGRVLKGSFQADGAGNVLAVSGVELEITEGTGTYALVSAGTGTLEAVVDVNSVPQFQGTLRLSF